MEKDGSKARKTFLTEQVSDESQDDLQDDHEDEASEHNDESIDVNKSSQGTPGDIVGNMSNRKSSKKGASKPRSSKMAVRQATMAVQQPVYRSAFAGKLTTKDDQLIDRGSNGGLAGADMRILHTSQRSVTINGIDNHHVPNIPVGTCCGLDITH